MDSAPSDRPVRIDGPKLRVLRERKGLSVTQFAAMVGLSYPTMHGIERGDRRTSLTSISKIAVALGVRIEDLVIANDPGEPNGPVEGPGRAD